MKISIIIISLNEVNHIERTIKSIKYSSKNQNIKNLDIEILVSDGGSNDGTIEIAKKLADKVIKSPQGRFKQLNQGAENAMGEILLFLHADTTLPQDAMVRILDVMRIPKNIAGGFEKSWIWTPNFHTTSFIRWLVGLWEEIGNWIVRLIKSYPGDNAIFIRKNVFNEIEGYSPLLICEGVDLMLRLKKYARKRKLKIIHVQSQVKTSARRYEEHGFFNVLKYWFILYILWRFGLKNSRLNHLFGKYSTSLRRNKRSVLLF